LFIAGQKKEPTQCFPFTTSPKPIREASAPCAASRWTLRLACSEEWIAQENGTFEFVVNEKPTFAGIDPYNKLIDRDPADNLIEAEKQ
jgi:hypothetical protein